MHYRIIDMASDPRSGPWLHYTHALADGLHISRFYENLGRELAALAENWSK